MKRKKLIILTIVVFVINYFLDRFTKFIAVKYIKGDDLVSAFWDTVRIVYVENSGAFLGMGQNWNIIVKYIVFIIIPIAFCLYGFYYCLFKETNKTRIIIFTSIVSGGLGNLFDRLFNNFRVIDFLNFGIGETFRTGILNVADMSVTFGVLAFFVYEYMFNKKNKTENEQSGK